MYLVLIGTHQFHVLIRIILAVIFISGLSALIVYLSRRTLKTFSAGVKKNGKLEFMNFDEARQRRANKRRNGRGKNGKELRRH